MIGVLNLAHRVKVLIRPLWKDYRANFSEKETVQFDVLDSERFRKLEFYADRACLGIPYCAHDDMRAFGLHSLFVPMYTVAGAYIDMGQREKFFWCQRVFEVGSDRCNSTASYISEFSWKAFREKEVELQSASISTTGGQEQ